jgi:hypothetical protein
LTGSYVAGAAGNLDLAKRMGVVLKGTFTKATSTSLEIKPQRSTDGTNFYDLPDHKASGSVIASQPLVFQWTSADVGAADKLELAHFEAPPGEIRFLFKVTGTATSTDLVATADVIAPSEG